MNQTKLNNMLKELIEEALEINIPVPSNIYPEVIINKRPKKRFGCCKLIDGVYRIEISSFIVKSNEKAIRNVVAHEILHTCKDCDNHGPAWKKYVSMMNRTYGYNIKRTSTFKEMGVEEIPSAPQEIKYIMKCQSCGKEYPRQRYTCVMKKINSYRCQCGGKLTVYKLK